MTTQLHLAAQYLAAAGISFLPKKDDDSHTNLGFNKEKGYLETWPLNKKGCKITFDYLNFALHWIANDTVRLSISLDGKTHKEVLHWLTSLTTSLGITNPYNYELHYELPYENITDDYVFKKPSTDILQKLLQGRILASTVLEEFLKTNKLDSEIRIWPHHFDTGAFATIKDASGISIGLGMAIPDTMIDDYYFYISGYHGHDSVDTSGFKELSIGTWKNDGFKGAVLPTTGIDKSQGVHFFNEALAQYKN